MTEWAMSWPTTLLLRVLNGSAGPAEKVLVHLRIVGGKKNDYSVGPYLTDERGEILIAREDVESEIRRVQQDFPMDYGPLVLAESRDLPVEVVVKSREELESDLRRSRAFFPDEAAHLEGLVRSARNDGRRTKKERIHVDEQTKAIDLQI